MRIQGPRQIARALLLAAAAEKGPVVANNPLDILPAGALVPAQPPVARASLPLVPLRLPSQPLHRFRLQDVEPNPHSLVLHKAPAGR